MSLRGSGVVVRFRLCRSEYQHLLHVAHRDDVSLSEAIRDALYEHHGIGQLTPVSSLPAPPAPPPRGPTPR